MTEVDIALKRTFKEPGYRWNLLWRGFLFRGQPGRIIQYGRYWSYAETRQVFSHLAPRDKRGWVKAAVNYAKTCRIWRPIEDIPYEISSIKNSVAYAIAYAAWKDAQ